MQINKATRRYETWLSEHTPLISSDLELKHRLMGAAVFPFLRATFYRWAQIFPRICVELADAPRVLAVGDLHIENFGTWRDAEGRLIWGINDFDEAYPLAYTNDLVRLAVSAHLAAEANHLKLSNEAACEAILEGYRASLQAGGRAFVLAEEHTWLRTMALNDLRNPPHFWSKLESALAVNEEIPRGARKALRSLLPENDLPYHLVHRIAGLGSLGRARWVALADWRGGKLAREVKGVAPSACAWAFGVNDDEIYAPRLVAQAVRCPDPILRFKRHWLVRRLAPDCSRIELADWPAERDEVRLLHAMGWETGNVHLGTPMAQSAISLDLKKRPEGWLHDAVKTMTRAIIEDWQVWKEMTMHQ